SYQYPDHIKQSINVERRIEPNDFVIKVEGEADQVTANVIQVIENSARTKRIQVDLAVTSDQTVLGDLEQDVIKLACLDRHHKSGDISIAFANGFQLKKGAVASTVAHDSHNLLVMGAND